MDKFAKIRAFTNGYCRARVDNAQRLLSFIQENGGVTSADIKNAGLTQFGIDRLEAIGLITKQRIEDPHRGKGCHHFLFKSASELPVNY